MARSVIRPVTMPLSHTARCRPTNSYMVDTEAPRVDNFTIDDALLTIGDNATVRLGFSEAVRLFAAADITNPNGSLPSMTSSDNGSTGLEPSRQTSIRKLRATRFRWALIVIPTSPVIMALLRSNFEL